MPTLSLADEQVLELIDQLSLPARAEVVRRLLADTGWERLLSYGESRLDAEFKKRGLARSNMSIDQIEGAIERIADGD